MTRIITLSAVQPPYAPAPTPTALRTERLRLLHEYLEVSAQRSSQLALLPELFNTLGLPPDFPLRDAAEPLEGETVSAARDLANRLAMALVLPIDSIDAAGRIWNCAVVIDYRGEIAGVYRKVHPTRAELAAGRTAGCDFPAFDVDVSPEAQLRIGVMICHDNSFVESARCLALAGAELICWPHIQSGWGDIVWDITLRSRAIDNGVWLLSSCYAVRGDQAWRPGMMVGRSSIVGPDGFILSEVARDAGVATVSVDFDNPRLVHSWSESEDGPFVEELRRDRRPDAYGRITDLDASRRNPT
jgi:predicted amidohydrolase